MPGSFDPKIYCPVTRDVLCKGPTPSNFTYRTSLLWLVGVAFYMLLENNKPDEAAFSCNEFEEDFQEIKLPPGSVINLMMMLPASVHAHYVILPLPTGVVKGPATIATHLSTAERNTQLRVNFISDGTRKSYWIHVTNHTVSPLTGTPYECTISGDITIFEVINKPRVD